jgi:uroporphyrinogen III methyltransferase/synthase
MTGALAGRTVLVTRARHQAGALEQLIAAHGGRAWLYPVIDFADPLDWGPLDEAIRNLHRYRWLVLTSQTGVAQFMKRLAVHGKGAGDLRHLQIAVVGSATARALDRYGLVPAVVPAEFRGAALPAAMAPLLAPGDRVLMARADIADPALAGALREQGAVVDDLVAYRTVTAAGDAGALTAALAAGEVHYVTFTSASTVRGLLEQVGGPAALARTRIAVIGPETKKAAEAAGLTVHVMPPAATMEALVQALAADAAGANTKEA